ncbi:ATP-dependent sacrificial sulfur transferase LarE [Kiritimatiellaeota bacterium B1221]|nr:ATP-dependent sacrificial sulfur transferase LarE [Kiritimatiellaeota bacterium B1221]
MQIPQKIEHWFAECPFAITAFSGGVDSSLVAWLAHHFLGPEKNLAVISASPSLKLSDLDGAKDFARENALPLRIIETKEMLNPDYVLNPANRCFFCKQTLYQELETLASEYSPCWVLNGTNVDDLGDYRPGLQAAKNFEVRSPLAECGLNKKDIRDLAESLNLSCWNKPAAPCLSSRIPYGQRVTLAKLRRIEKAEAWLQAAGFDICRVRHEEPFTARVEVASDRISELCDLKSSIETAFAEMGFESVILDEEGFVSGKLNRVLKVT